jgi:hypothetical protein
MSNPASAVTVRSGKPDVNYIEFPEVEPRSTIINSVDPYGRRLLYMYAESGESIDEILVKEG